MDETHVSNKVGSILVIDGSDGKESACSVGDMGSSLIWEDPLEKGMATHCIFLAWRFPWTEATVHGMAKSQIGLGD